MIETREDYSPEESNTPPRETALPENDWGTQPPSIGEVVIPEPSERLWTFADLGLFLLFALASMVLAAGTVFGGFSALNKILGLGMSIEDSVAQTAIAVSIQVLWEICWVVFIYHIVVDKYRLGFWKGLKWDHGNVQPSKFVLAGVALSIAIQLSSQFFPKRADMPIEKLFDTPSSAYLLAFFGICVAPFMEEMVFRGFFYPVLEKRWGTVAAVLITGTSFAALHAQQVGGIGPELLAILAVGMTLSTVRAMTGSLKPSFLMHLGYNSTLFILLFISTNRFQTLAN